MQNGDVHDSAPVYAGDRQAETGDYAMTYNPQAGHVALYRRHLIRPEDALDPPFTAALGHQVRQIGDHCLEAHLGGGDGRAHLLDLERVLDHP